VRKREWIRCADPQRMVREVAWHPTGGNERRLRLFTLTAGRRLWGQLEDEACRLAVDVAWRQAEGLASAEEVAERDEALGPVYDEACATNSWEVARLVNVISLLFREPGSAAWALVAPSSVVGGGQPVPLLTAAEAQACCGLLREIFGDRGNPVTIDRDLLAWNDGTVVNLARTIYAEQRFEDLPILADALEEAGCTDQDILGHCRQQRAEHVPGCWVLDLILSKDR
jgi:hypothetical protein